MYIHTCTCTCTSLISSKNGCRVEPPGGQISSWTSKLHERSRGHTLSIGRISFVSIGKIWTRGKIPRHGGLVRGGPPMMVVDRLHVQASSTTMAVVDRLHLTEDSPTPFWFSWGLLVMPLFAWGWAPVITGVNWWHRGVFSTNQRWPIS